ncbi:MAG: ABC transporter permease [Roseiflexaceae bacterium]|nr:ABC transporter permease [Roseiflexaceae bacterium]
MATSAGTLTRGRLPQAERKPRSLWSDAWKRLTRNKAAVLGIVFIVLMILVAIFADLLAQHNPVQQNAGISLRPPVWVQTGNPATSGLSEYPLGTDSLGRDMLSRLIFGARVSLIVGLIPTTIVVVIGVTFGLIAGYAGGWIDNLMMRIVDIVTAFPDLLFLITVGVAFRDTPFGQAFNGLLLIFVALAIVGWTGLTRLVRGQVLSLKQKEFIEAARTVGVSRRSILFKHLLPNAMAPVIVAISFAIPAFILAEAVLTIIGVGMRPSVNPDNPFPTSWGVLMSDGFASINSNPWALFFPVLLVSGTMLAFTSLGDGLRDALDPRDN